MVKPIVAVVRLGFIVANTWAVMYLLNVALLRAAPIEGPVHLVVVSAINYVAFNVTIEAIVRFVHFVLPSRYL